MAYTIDSSSIKKEKKITLKHNKDNARKQNSKWVIRRRYRMHTNSFIPFIHPLPVCLTTLVRVRFFLFFILLLLFDWNSWRWMNSKKKKKSRATYDKTMKKRKKKNET